MVFRAAASRGALWACCWAHCCTVAVWGRGSRVRIHSTTSSSKRLFTAAAVVVCIINTQPPRRRQSERIFFFPATPTWFFFQQIKATPLLLVANYRQNGQNKRLKTPWRVPLRRSAKPPEVVPSVPQTSHSRRRAIRGADGCCETEVEVQVGVCPRWYETRTTTRYDWCHTSSKGWGFCCWVRWNFSQST